MLFKNRGLYSTLPDILAPTKLYYTARPQSCYNARWCERPQPRDE